MDKLAEMFKALSDETRVRIMAMLMLHGELCVCDVEGALQITQSKSSRHLRYLLHAGLVENSRKGVWMHYHIPHDLEAAQKVLIGALRKMLSESQTEELKTRLDRWFEEKQLSAPDCQAS